MVHLSKAFNFNIRQDATELPTFQSHFILISPYRLVKIVDGKFGTIVDADTNSFNGMIGMVQRLVSMNIVALEFLTKLI